MNKAMRTDVGATASNVVEGGVVAVTVAVLKKTVFAMIPFALPALVLVALDLHFGIKAARHRYKKYKREEDRVTFSKALRGTVGKVFEFAAWLILASSASIAFEKEWIQWATLGLVYLNELASIVGNYLCTKNIDFDLLAFLRNVLVFVGRWVGSKIGIVTDDVSFDDVLKPTRPGRNAKGQFVSRKKGKK
jgi:hypothetical protein